jgi:receptor protein-tyrosine kinase
VVSDPELQQAAQEFAVNEHSDMRDFLALLRRHLFLIAAIALLTGVATYFVTVREPAVYTSNTTLLYSEGQSVYTQGTSAAEDPARAVATIVGISTSSDVLAPVAARLGTTVGALQQALVISDDPNSDILGISATAPTPARAAVLARADAQALISYTAVGEKTLLRAQAVSLQQQLQAFSGETAPSDVAAAADVRSQLAETQAELAIASSPLSVLTPAVVPGSPTSPHPTRDAAIGLVVGLLLGVMFGALRDRLDRRIRGFDEIHTLYRAPMLGVVPFMKGRRLSRSQMLADFSGAGPLADAYRTIRTNLAILKLNSSDTAVIVVTSATAEEGKSAVAANLSHSLAVMGKKVLVVSADLHNPTLHEYFDDVQDGGAALPTPGANGNSARLLKWVPPNPRAGLVQVLAGQRSVSNAARLIPLNPRERASGGSLELIADASTFFDPSVLLSSEAMLAFLDEARRQYDIIVLDTPPLLANADATLLAQEATAVVLVARLDQVTKNQARRAAQVLAATGITPTGVIVTGDTDEPTYGYGYRFEDETRGAVTDGGPVRLAT